MSGKRVFPHLLQAQLCCPYPGGDRRYPQGIAVARPRDHPEYGDLPAQRPDREARRTRSKAPADDQKRLVQAGAGPVARDPERRPRPIEMESDSGRAGRVRRAEALQLSITVGSTLMSEAELHVLHARLDGGIRNKAARGELRRGLPVGLVWGERDGEIRLHPDEAVTGAVRAVFERFAEFGSVRRVWLWFVSEKLTFPLRLNHGDAIRWIPPSYHAIHQVLTNPAYAGAYTYGKSLQERVVDENGVGPQACASSASLGVAGADHRPPPGLYRLADLRGQPRPHRGQHAAATACRGERSRQRRKRAAARPRHVRPLRAAAVCPCMSSLDIPITSSSSPTSAVGDVQAVAIERPPRPCGGPRVGVRGDIASLDGRYLRVRQLERAHPLDHPRQFASGRGEES